MSYGVHQEGVFSNPVEFYNWFRAGAELLEEIVGSIVRNEFSTHPTSPKILENFAKEHMKACSNPEVLDKVSYLFGCYIDNLVMQAAQCSDYQEALSKVSALTYGKDAEVVESVKNFTRYSVVNRYGSIIKRDLEKQLTSIRCKQITDSGDEVVTVIKSSSRFAGTKRAANELETERDV